MIVELLAAEAEMNRIRRFAKTTADFQNLNRAIARVEALRAAIERMAA